MSTSWGLHRSYCGLVRHRRHRDTDAPFLCITTCGPCHFSRSLYSTFVWYLGILDFVTPEPYFYLFSHHFLSIKSLSVFIRILKLKVIFRLNSVTPVPFIPYIVEGLTRLERRKSLPYFLSIYFLIYIFGIFSWL